MMKRVANLWNKIAALEYTKWQGNCSFKDKNSKMKLHLSIYY